MIAALFQQDPYLVDQTLTAARLLFATLNDVEKRLGTPGEKPDDRGLAQQTAHRIRNRQVLLLVIKTHLNLNNPEIEFLCQFVPHRYEAVSS